MDRTRRILLISIVVLFVVLTLLLVGNRLFMSNGEGDTLAATTTDELGNSMTLSGPSMELGVAGEIARLIKEAKDLANASPADYISAIERLKEALTLNPTDAEHSEIVSLVNLYLENLKRQDAINGIQRDYSEYDSLVGESGELDDEIEEIIRTARTLALENNYDQALDTLERGERLNPSEEQRQRILALKQNYLELLRERTAEEDSETDSEDHSTTPTYERSGQPTESGSDRPTLNRTAQRSTASSQTSNRTRTSHSSANQTRTRAHNTRRAQNNTPIHETPPRADLPIPETVDDPTNTEQRLTRLIVEDQESISDVLNDPEASNQWTALGREENRLGNYEKAEEYLENAIDLNPSNSDAFAELSRAQLRQEEYNEAMTNAQRALRLNNEDGNALTVLGESYYFQNQPERAAEYFSQALQRNSENPIAAYRMGVILYEQQNYQQAVRYFSQAIDILSEKLYEEAERLHLPCFAEYNRAQAFNKLGKNEEALASLDNALRIQPQHEKSLILKGQILFKKAQQQNTAESYQEVVAVLRTTVRHHPNAYDAHFILGRAYLALSEYGSAETSFEKAVQLNPQSYRAQYNLGLAYNRSGKFRSAVRAFEQAIQLNRDDPALYVEFGRALHQTQNYRRSISIYEDGLQTDRSNVELYRGLIEVHDQMGNYDQAMRIIQLARQNNALESDILVKEADIYFKLERFDDAAQRYSSLVNQNPRNVQLRLKYAQTLYQTADNRGALAQINSILQSDPNNREANRLKRQIESGS